MHVGTFKKELTKYFPVPKYLDIPSVGVDISPWAIRFIEIVSFQDHFRVANFAHERLKNIFNLENPESKEEIIEILVGWKKKFKLNYVEVSLPEEKAYLYTTSTPSGTNEEMRASIEITLEENVPINPGEAIFDYRIVHQNDDGKIEVAVTVLPQDIIKGFLELFETGGLTPISFLIEAQALSKAIVPKNNKDLFFIVNIGELKTGLFIVSEGSVQFTSTLLIGGKDLTEDLIKNLNISREEAEKIKNTIGLSQKPEDKEILNSLLQTSSELKNEIEKIYLYWNNQQTIKKLDNSKTNPTIILCGKDALMHGFKEYISQNLNIKTELANVWTNVASFDQYIPPINSKDALDFGRAIGLSLPKIN